MLIYQVRAAAWQNVLSARLTDRFFPVWQWWWHRTGHCQRLGSGRAPPKEKTHSLLWSSYVLVLPLEEGQGIPPDLRCFSQEPCHVHRLALRLGAEWELCPVGCGYLRWVWWGWWSLKCWGFLSWRPGPHLMSAKVKTMTNCNKMSWGVPFLSSVCTLINRNRDGCEIRVCREEIVYQPLPHKQVFVNE